MNPKEFVHNTAYSVQLPYIAGLSTANYNVHALTPLQTMMCTLSHHCKL